MNPPTTPPANSEAVQAAMYYHQMCDRLWEYIKSCGLYQDGTYGFPCDHILIESHKRLQAALAEKEKELTELRELCIDAKREAESFGEQLVQKTGDWLAQPQCCSGTDCACMGASRLETIIWQETGIPIHEILKLKTQLAAANKRIEELENAKPNHWLPKSMTVADIAAQAEQAEQERDRYRTALEITRGWIARELNHYNLTGRTPPRDVELMLDGIEAALATPGDAAEEKTI